jgi:hypothetical protein
MLAAVRSYIRRHHIALLALFVALGSTSYAATTLPRNSVGRPQLKAGAVASPEVQDRSLRPRDFAGGLRGRRGPRGADGAPGAPGPAGSPAASMIMGNTDFTPATTPGNVAAFPPSGFTDNGEAPTDSFANLQPTPNAPVVVRDLYGKLAAAPGAAGETNKTRMFRLVAATGQTLLSCLVVADDTDCDSGGQAATLAPGTQLRIEIVNGADTVNPSTGGRWAFRATTP